MARNGKTQADRREWKILELRHPHSEHAVQPLQKEDCTDGRFFLSSASRSPELAMSAAPPSESAPASLPTLFKVISPKDEVIIGLPESDLAAVAGKLAADGTLVAHQYATRRAKDGSLEVGPLKKVAIMKNDALRIEEHRAAQPVAPLPAE
ncbi:hypothetical protein DFJ74DRAFT_764554 [Hyaloraphidium curvatum]|nr:hypothetical protein DFJ74DRAFT_764554 [Hyaloraphidium curvatum]